MMIQSQLRKKKQGKKTPPHGGNAVPANIKLYLKQQLENSEELKYSFQNSGNLVVVTNVAPYIQTVMANVAQGVTDSQRVGDRLKIHSLSWRVRLTTVVPATVQGEVRLLVVQTRASSQLLTFAMIQLLFNEASGNPGPLSHQSVDYEKEHKILWDSTHYFDGYGTGIERFVEIIVPMGRCAKQVQYNGGAATCENEIRLIALTNLGAAPNNATLTGQSFLRFTDA